MKDLALASKHLTPAMLREELTKLSHNGIDVLAVHIKPAYRETIIRELTDLKIDNLSVMETGRVYEW